MEIINNIIFIINNILDHFLFGHPIIKEKMDHKNYFNFNHFQFNTNFNYIVVNYIIVNLYYLFFLINIVIFLNLNILILFVYKINNFDLTVLRLIYFNNHLNFVMFYF